MAQIGIGLLEHALDSACPNFVSCMSQTAMRHGVSWVAQQSVPNSGGICQCITLLHRAVASGSLDLVDLVIKWSDEFRFSYSWGHTAGSDHDRRLMNHHASTAARDVWGVGGMIHQAADLPCFTGF